MESPTGVWIILDSDFEVVDPDGGQLAHQRLREIQIRGPTNTETALDIFQYAFKGAVSTMGGPVTGTVANEVVENVDDDQ
jgi:hypothetical protein